MNRYTLRINCTGFQDMEVGAETEQEAIKLAEDDFRCHGASVGEYCETLYVATLSPKEEQQKGRPTNMQRQIWQQLHTKPQ